MYKVVISGERNLWILHYCNHASASGYCTFLLLSSLSAERKVKENQTNVVLYNVGIRCRTIFFTHFVVNRDQAENRKGGMYSKNFFKVAGNLLQMDCQLKRDAVDV